MAKTLRINEALRIFPHYDDYPNIDITGSLTGMKRIYGWDTKYVVGIGKYYYNLKAHPNAKNFFG